MSAPSPLRVGYLCDADPFDRWSWSGTHHYMLHALRAEGLSVTHLGRSQLPPHATRASLILRRILGRRPDVREDPLDRARRWADAVAADLARDPMDVLFAPVGATVIAFLKTDLPIAYLSDTTFRLLRGYYPEVRLLSEDDARAREELEARAIAAARLLIYPSTWAATSAIQDYGAAADRVRTLAMGGNLDGIPSADDVMKLRKRSGTCRLLFLGRDWRRKGGDLAIDCVRSLRAQGVAAELTLVGSAPPGAVPEGVTVAGSLDKRKPADQRRLHRLLLESSFLVLPTRADCYSMVAAEASAFGLPTLITDTGGTGGAVENGRNGTRVSPDADGETWAREVRRTWDDPEVYARLVRSTRAHYDERMSWPAWGRSVAFELRALSR